MTKVVLITDTHFGARGDSIPFAEYFAEFYKNVFFPYLKENGITDIIHLGDIVERRKYINYMTSRHLREDFIKPCSDNGINLRVIIGNHDTFFKNTNDVNSMDELYNNSNYKFEYYSSPSEIEIGGLKIALLPWVCSGNYQDSMDFVSNTSAQVLFGHLEIQGFEMHKGAINDHGLQANVFNKFDMVCSGHFHHKSSRGNIHYLGAPYEITWSDYNDPRGFHVFDTDTRTLKFIQNPYTMFNKIHYDDTSKTLDEVLDIDVAKYKNTFLKVVITAKNNPLWFDMFIDKLEKASLVDMQVVEDHLNLNIEDDDDIYSAAEDTPSILRKAANSIQSSEHKKELDILLQSLYNDALDVESL